MSDGAVGRTARADAEQALALQTLVHDLRQPVLAITLLVELLGGREDLPEEIRAQIQQLDLESRWLAELLTVTEGTGLADSGVPPPATPTRDARATPGRSDASSAARAAVVSARSSYDGVLVLSAPGPAVVTADQTALRRAISNLVENATRAAGPHGHVHVGVYRDDASVRVVVEDDGPGFGRVQMGKRLGLTVVAQAVISGGGTVEIGSSELGGVRVTLHLKEAGIEIVGPGE